MIRLATKKDAASIWQIEKDCIECPWTNEMILNSFDENYKFLLYEEREQILGYCSFKIVFNETEINNIAVRKDFRNHGVANAILTFLAQYAVKSGSDRIFLEVNENNVAAISLYGKHNFKTISIRKNYYKSGNALVMQKDLK